MANIKVKVNNIETVVVELFDPNDNSLGLINEYQCIDIQCQIAEMNVDGYYIIHNTERININKIGELDKWPVGMFDYTQRQFRRLFKARKNTLKTKH